MDLSAELKKRIEIAIGREISSSEQGGVDSFLKLSEIDIHEINLLERSSGVLAISYIRFKLRGNVTLSLATSFYSSVIQQGVPAKEWLRGLNGEVSGV